MNEKIEAGSAALLDAIDRYESSGQMDADQGAAIGKEIAREIKSGMGARACASAAGRVLKRWSKKFGQNPAIEVAVRGPGDHHYAGNCWIAMWESGPYEWAIPASFEVGAKILAEPYFSFDLCFYPAEGVAR